MKKWFVSLGAVWVQQAYALPPNSLGDLSDKLLFPMSVLTAALYNISLAIGVALLFGAFIQYRNHRKNPGQVLLSRPVTLLVFGLILLVLPVLVKISESSQLVSRVS
jgi:Ca2+/H+ antiporter